MTTYVTVLAAKNSILQVASFLMSVANTGYNVLFGARLDCMTKNRLTVAIKKELKPELGAQAMLLSRLYMSLSKKWIFIYGIEHKVMKR